MRLSVDHRGTSDWVGWMGVDTTWGMRQARMVRCHTSGPVTIPPDRLAPNISPWSGVQGRGRTGGGESGVASLEKCYDSVGPTTRGHRRHT